jgi:hypothetical protein
VTHSVVGRWEPSRNIIGTMSAESLGEELGSMTAPTTAVWPSANLAIYVPFRVAASITVDRMWVYKGGTAAGNIDIGIYNDAGTRLVSLGSTADAGTTVIVTFDVANTTLSRGYYYLAFACSDGTATFARAAIGGNMPFGVKQEASALPLPATATMVDSMTTNYIPILGLTTGSVLS